MHRKCQWRGHENRRDFLIPLFLVFFPFRMLPPREGRLQALLHLVARDGQRGRRGRLQRRLSKGLLLPLLQLQVSSEKPVTGLVIFALRKRTH